MIDAEYPVGSGKTIYLNSKTGQGFDRLISILRPFFQYQLSAMSFPGHSREDVEQEMLKMAIEALPRYDASKQANLLTFLQNHIKNRLINMCKFYAEKRRCASYVDSSVCKIRCNACRSFFKDDRTKHVITCPKCNESCEKDSGMWKFYNIAVIPTQMPTSLFGDKEIDIEIDQDFVQFTPVARSSATESADFMLDLRSLLSGESEANKSIITLICQGYSKNEVAAKTGISAGAIGDFLRRIGQKIKHNVGEIDGNSAI